MPNVDTAHIARLKKRGNNFEILVDAAKALDFKHGQNIPMSDILAGFEVYKDARKGERASNLSVFGTDDVEKIAEIILREGEIQLTAEYLKKEREKRLKEIINEIHKQAIDPVSKLPIPVTRIENAFEEIKFHVDINKSLQKEVEEVIDKLKYIMPIKIERKRLSVVIPASYAAKSFSVLKQFSKIENEEWLGDGSLRAVVSLLAGDYNDFVNSISKSTKGEVEIKNM